MLRVRPIISTAAPDTHATLLTALGLRCVHDDGELKVFDSGNGKVGVLDVPAGEQCGTTELGFELRDAEVFVRRTLAEGTHAELVNSGQCQAARVTAPGGFNFLATESSDLSLPTAGARLGVAVLWRTPNPEVASKVLADIGALHVMDSPDGGALFRTKNGGQVGTAAGAVTGVELSVRYGGGLAFLADKLAAVGIDSELAAATLRVPMPDGGTLTVADWLDS
ncbi:VOC family protein [Arthrobacter sp. LAPM80]|uniref:VOC family protein n=1 Tax=Arthrobacter sp. LAPM80 TaxID=3141788 RepID=UPI00398AA300